MAFSLSCCTTSTDLPIAPSLVVIAVWRSLVLIADWSSHLQDCWSPSLSCLWVWSWFYFLFRVVVWFEIEFQVVGAGVVWFEIKYVFSFRLQSKLDLGLVLVLGLSGFSCCCEFNVGLPIETWFGFSFRIE